ncbi:5992_t:CDS:1, partial [Dentiscutata heterogama]
ITLSITTPKQLTSIAKTLRKHFFFSQLPSDWIQIPTRKTESKTNSTDTLQPLPEIPTEITELRKILISYSIKLKLPIQSQEEVTPTMKVLRQQFSVKTIPVFILELSPLPKPSWTIFSNAVDQPPSSSTVQSLASTPLK